MRPLTRLLRIQYATNLEVGQKKVQGLLRPVAPILALTGPARTENRDFLQFCSQHWLHVFVVSGSRVGDRVFPNVHFMNRAHMECEGVRFIGAPDGDYAWARTLTPDLPTVLLSHRAPKSLTGLRAAVSSEALYVESGSILRLPARESFIEISIPVESVEDYRDPLLVASAID